MADARDVEWLLAVAGLARRRLSFEEVLKAGLPAVYSQFGERLLFMDGRILDARDPSALAEVLLGVVSEPDQAVGLEFGWRHAGDCSCPFCSKGAAGEAA